MVSDARASTRDRDLIWVETPFGAPASKVAVAAARAGALGVLDLGAEADTGRRALEIAAGRTGDGLAVRVSERCPLTADDLPEAVGTVVVASSEDAGAWRGSGRRVVAEVRSVDEARDALAAGVDGLVARGAESGGRVGTTGTFVLLQQVRALTDVPVWAQGGIGPRTAAAAVAGGAAGVVVDGQTALLRESALPRPVRAAIAAMDGSETRIVGGHRIFTRPDLWVAALDDSATADEIAGRLGAGSLEDQALPAGQDAGFAARFAARYGTVGAMVAALRRDIAGHIEAAHRVEPLAAGHGVAASVGTTYPVVQGPMTRVSDRAAFAAAVAEGGGLPFLALALLRGETEVRPLLEETAALLGDRPWGVGVLGFVPKDLRDEQLAVIRDVRPPVALIAGGRPSQAAGLEEAGIRTFLHVPAPGLLQRFLKDGARRFVFEGFECGGHVGPRSSFALWESQLAVLENWAADGGALDELDLLFAGGVHDERSAAMVAALAGRVADAGARVGVLMGTAYLLTDEAVAAGAIGDEFQSQALACERTALLESGPGHVTRCAETPFVDLFNETRERMAAEGVDPQDRWAELEGLNLGRLRVASKGLRRDGDELVQVDRDEQRSEGMFMIGDVATLRNERTTVAALHESVTAGATRYMAALVDDRGAELAAQAEARSSAPEPRPVDVAIVGMACVMPGAPELEDFWRNVVEGVNSITEVPPERWDVDTYFDPTWEHSTAHLRTGSASKWGGFLPDIPFDALSYGIPPASLAAIEPTQLLSLKVAADSLADAGYADRPFDRDRTSVVFGAEGGTDQVGAHGFRALYPSYLGEMPPELSDWLPRISEDSFPGLLTNVIAGRIANRLDLGGRNLTVDAACASSLAALDVACGELATGGSDVVLCGGADLHNGVQDFLLFTSVHALSTTGQCRTFDADADGIALGEGVACVVLKRLADAERDGDRIYAVVRGVGSSSDGRSLGLTAPRQDGQERAVRRAYAQAGVDAAEVGLLEAHGTGTVVGDRTELATLTEVFGQAGMGRAACAVGSVKSNIGHTKCAAGLAGLIKAAKAVYHGVRPPTLHIDRPNQAWDADTSPFVFLDETRPWPDGRRLAGVSAFGFGGTNFHAVLESHADDDVPDRAVDVWPAELFAFRGDDDAVDRALDDLAARLAEPAPPGHRWRLRDIAAAVSTAGRGPVRVALVADDVEDLRAKVARARQRQAAPGVMIAGAGADSGGGTGTGTRPGVDAATDAAPTVAFLFPGQGSQRPGMASDLFVHFAETRPLLRLGERWAGAMLPPAAFDDDGRDAQRQAVTDTRVAQPALGLAGLAAATVLDRFGVRPGMVAGHSYGELVALSVAGALDTPTLLELSETRGRAMVEAVPDGDAGGMVAVSATRERLDEVLTDVDVVVANDNHPTQIVVAGTTPAVEEALGRLKDAGITAKRLPVACAFHSPVVAAASDTLARHLDGIEVGEPRLPVYSNLTADVYPADGRKVRDLLSAQVANGVRFTDEVRAMYEAGARVFVEVGPGRTLTGCVERILEGRPHVAVATDRPGQHGVRALLLALAELAVAGVSVDVAELFEGRAADARRWTHPAAAARWTVNGHLVRTDSGEVVPGGLRPATTVPAVTTRAAAPGGEPVAVPAFGGGAPHVPVAAGAQADQVLVEYFRAAQEIIGAGHSLVLNYLGVAPAQQTPAVAPVVPGLLPGAPDALSPAAPAVAPGQESAAGDVAAGAAPAAAPATAAPAGRVLPEPEVLLEKLTVIVSARTGYPEDMLGPDLDVEADLSIDSIKRLEILGELADDIGLTDGGSLDELEDLVEELAARKTLRGIVDFLGEHADRLGASPAGAAPVPGAVSGATGATGGRSPRELLGTPEALLEKLTVIVSARTGYPEDMLGPDLDVEADLSIDSIKRLEILGELADDIGLTDGGSLDQLEDLVEELAARKTLRGVVGFLFEHADRLGGTGDGGVTTSPSPSPGPNGDGPTEHMGDATRADGRASAPASPNGNGAGNGNGNGTHGAPSAADASGGIGGNGAASAAGGPGAVGGVSAAAADIPARADRFVVALVEAPLGDERPLDGRTVDVTGDGRLAAALVDELTRRGASAQATTADAAATGGSDVVVMTDLLGGTPAGTGDAVQVPAFYARMRPVLLDGGADVLVVAPLGGGLGIDPPAPPGPGDGGVVPLGAGARGLVKTAALEFGDRAVRLVDLDPAAPADDLARRLADEVAQADAPVEVGWRDDTRRAPAVAARPDGPTTAPLTDESVVLLAGGARGITAEVAIALGRAHRCRIELVGRSALPADDEDPTLAACPDAPALRGALARSGWREPKAIEAEVARLLAAREVRSTLAALRSAGSAVTYHQADVRDAEALAAVVRSVYERHGRLDGVVHGAGMLDDHFIADKTPDDFARVFATKVDAARTLLGSLAAATADGCWGPPAFVVFFGSIAGVCGNRGQADYAAANDALDTLAAAHRDVAGRVVALDWGPWSPEAGMVSDALARMFRDSGMGLIEPADGTAVVLDEVARVGGPDAPSQVVVARCSRDLMAASLGHGRSAAAAPSAVGTGAPARVS